MTTTNDEIVKAMQEQQTAEALDRLAETRAFYFASRKRQGKALPEQKEQTS